LKQFLIYYMNLSNLSDDHHWDVLYPNTPAGIGKTHVFMKSIEANDLDDAYMKMQGEMWSMGDEQEAAQELVRKSGAEHTSMMIGDVIFDVQWAEFYMVDTVGFKHLC